jgi:hypothetical protein
MRPPPPCQPRAHFLALPRSPSRNHLPASALFLLRCAPTPNFPYPHNTANLASFFTTTSPSNTTIRARSNLTVTRSNRRSGQARRGPRPQPAKTPRCRAPLASSSESAQEPSPLSSLRCIVRVSRSGDPVWRPLSQSLSSASPRVILEGGPAK